MVSTSRNKKQDVDGVEKTLNKSSATPGRKPLLKYKFYLDIKNRVNASKLEAKIKEFGGCLELFPVKEVTHIITDREGWSSYKGGGPIPLTPPGHTNDSFNTSINSPNSSNATCRPKSRADAMLERARRCSNVIAKDPLEDAKRWGISIFSVEKALAWFDKLSVSVVPKKKNSNFFELKEPYIKFESFKRTRPIFRQIHNWPVLNLFGPAGEPGLVCRSPAERNMTRKTRSHHSRNDTANRPGYCEVCRNEYLKLEEHLESDKHLSFVKNNGNFLGLDTLINNGTNFETFLKANCIAIDGNDTLDSKNCPPLKRNKMPRTRTNSHHIKVKSSPLSPTGSDKSTRLRSRNIIANNFVQHFDEIEEEFKLELPTRGLRSSARQSSIRKSKEFMEIESDTWSSGRPKRQCIKNKRISADERLVVDNKTYYKVEVLSSKLRSSDVNLKISEAPRRVQTPIFEEKEEEDKGLIVKFKRMRTSELSQLNNEAENFLFPRKDESETETDIDADNPNTTVSSTRGNTTVILSSDVDEYPLKRNKSKQEIIDESSMDTNCSIILNHKRRRRRSIDSMELEIAEDKRKRRSSIDSNCSTDTQKSKRRKRRTHAEALILDNKKYYKFETPGSRLRYQGSFLTPVPSIKSPKSNGECVNTKDGKDTRKLEMKEIIIEKKEDTKPEPKTETKINLEDLKFSFERIPKSEPWYETFQRQDRGDVFYTSFSESGYFWKPLLLPYEMGPIPPLDPRICINTYQQLKKQLLDSGSASTSAGSNTPDHNCLDGDSSSYLNDENSKGSEDSDMADGKTLEDSDNKGKNKRRRGIIVVPGKNPRKSPRQHASTLAILSSLIQQRKRREKSRNADSLPKPSSLPTIPEDIPVTPNNTVLENVQIDESQETECVINEIDSALLEYSEEELDIPIDREICFHVEPDAIEILEEYEHKKAQDIHLGYSSPYKRFWGLPKRKPGKKRTNKTGWPNKSNRRTKKEDNKDGSTVDSISTRAESEDDNNSVSTDMNGDVNSIKSEKVRLKKVVRKNSEHALADTNNRCDQSSLRVNSEHNSVQTKNNSKKIESDKEDRVHRNKEQNHTDCVVDLDKWENAEKVLSAKLTNTELINNDLQFQPYVVVKKLESDITLKHGGKRSRSSSSPHRTNVKKSRRMPASPKSPRALRKPRGRWYRER